MGVTGTNSYGVLTALSSAGWHLQDMTQFEQDIYDIVPWCRDTFGGMLVSTVLDIDTARWHGTTVSRDGRHFVIFAFREQGDLALMLLKWSGQ